MVEGGGEDDEDEADGQDLEWLYQVSEVAIGGNGRWRVRRRER